jgi:predicted transcriptional regulator
MKEQQVAQIVSAYVKNNSVSATEIPALIASVSESLTSLGQASTPATVALVPAVPIRRSVMPDKITCLECGWSGSMIKRHLGTHDLDPAGYRARWGLGNDYPLVARNYAAKRSELAKSIGLGTRGKTRRRKKA